MDDDVVPAGRADAQFAGTQVADDGQVPLRAARLAGSFSGAYASSLKIGQFW